MSLDTFNNPAVLRDLHRVMGLDGTAEFARDFDPLTMAQVLRDELPKIKRRCAPSTYAVVLGVTATLFKRGADDMFHKLQKFDGHGNAIPKKAALSVVDGGRGAAQPPSEETPDAHA